jgi:6-phosphofructokinase 1
VQRLAVLTSGGDAPGMNAAIRAVVRSAIARGYEAVGVHDGFTGLIHGDVHPLGARDVGGIIQLGGTKLGTTRCEAMRTGPGREQALDTIQAHSITGLVIIGGNGSQAGASVLHDCGVHIVGIASTIDNDLYGSDITIGATTAVDIALHAIDSLRVTASAMRRAFLLEVMGRHCGYLALMAGIAGGAEVIVLPETEAEPEAVAEELRAAYARGKSHAIAVVAEGARYDADALMQYFRVHHDRLGYELRATKLGHIQRGGAPGMFDRMLGTLLGAAAVDAAAEGRYGVLVGMRDGKPATTPLREVADRPKFADTRLLELARVLAM